MRDEYLTIIGDMTDPTMQAAIEEQMNRRYAAGWEPYQYLAMNDVLVATLVKVGTDE